MIDFFILWGVAFLVMLFPYILLLLIIRIKDFVKKYSIDNQEVKKKDFFI
tara:strand:+ start:103 stop:252 length:150 start_codon:yes stop_codon:yes gene_type:complete